jgi:hypothetical protein
LSNNKKKRSKGKQGNKQDKKKNKLTSKEKRRWLSGFEKYRVVCSCRH